MDIINVLKNNGVEYFKAWDIKTAFEKKFGNKLYILATSENWILDHVSDVVNFDIVKTSWNDSNYGEMPSWIEPIRVEHLERKDQSGWKQHEWRGTFNFNNNVVYGMLENHFHIDRQKIGDAIENTFWCEKAGF